MLAAAADEVSIATATLFSSYAEVHQALIGQATQFHYDFARLLTTANSAYSDTEIAAMRMLRAPAEALSEQPLISGIASLMGAGTNVNPSAARSAASAAASLFSDPNITLVIGGSGNPIPNATYITSMVNNYVTPSFPDFTLPNAQVLYTPEGAYPIYPVGNGIKSLTFDDSVAQGVKILTDTLIGTGVGQHGLIIPGGNHVVVTGFSQSTVISSLVMKNLAAMGPNAPTADQLGFVLLADPMNHNGGLFQRFPGLTFPSFGLTYTGSTPPDTIYPTQIYSIEYDGYADFPQYPLNFVSDLNAVMGIYYAHPLNPYLNPADLPPGYGIQALPTSPDYTGVTTYYMITVPHLPLLEPVRAIPVIGGPIADLLEPDLTMLVNLGYGSTAQGWSTGYANVPTQFGLFPPVDPTAVIADLASGAHQGILAASYDFSVQQAQGWPELSRLPIPSISTLPNITSDISHALTLNPVPALNAISHDLASGTTVNNVITALQIANIKISTACTNAVGTAYSTLLPTADSVSALLISIPAYDVSLFLDGVRQMVNGQPLVGLVNAIGNPIAANVGLITILGGSEALVMLGAAKSIVNDFASLL